MTNNEFHLAVKLTRTLWFNIYRGKVTDQDGNYIASIRIIPTVPLDRDEVPPDAPEAVPCLTVLVDDGIVTTDDLISFESSLAPILLAKFQREDFKPEYCHYFYPSPMSMMEIQTCM
ncbi:MAG: hypothetical protein N2491_06665 [Negativicutes bacterium]|nr:hypothetical protein [Negativicutes bacterium]